MAGQTKPANHQLNHLVDHGLIGKPGKSIRWLVPSAQVLKIFIFKFHNNHRKIMNKRKTE
jgi:hypothetical protein